MNVIVNAESQDLPEGATVADVVRRLGRDPDRPGAAAVVNGEMVARGQWHEHRLADSDRVEVVAAVQGGSQ